MESELKVSKYNTSKLFTFSSQKNSICSVCLEKGEPEKLSGDKGHSLLKCIKCNVVVHLRCYGEKNLSSGVKQDNSFECEKCINKDTNCTCVVCKQKDGLMKRLDVKKYIHILCALFTDYFEISDFSHMKIDSKIPLAKFEKTFGGNARSKKNGCEFCGESSGVLLQCECDEECYNKAHLYCAQKDKIEKLLKDSDSSDFWQIDWKLIPRDTEGTQIIDIYPSEGESNLTYQDESNFLNSNLTNSINSNINQNKNKKTKNNKQSKDESSGKLIKSDIRDNLLQNDNNLNNIQQELLIINERNYFLHNRGGKIKILCESHREELIYCICRKTSGNEFMLCCDNCETWFHGRCVGYSNKEVNTLKKWYCSFCTDWINNRNNYLIKEINFNHLNDEVTNDDLIKQSKESSWKLPVIHNHINYKVIDLIFISILFSKRADILIRYPCNLELLSKHIKTAYSIPIRFSKIVLKLKNKLEKFSSNKISEDLKKIEELRKFDFSKLNEITNNTEKIRILQINYSLVESLHKTYIESSDGVIESNFIILKSLLKKFKWGLDAMNLVTASPKETFISDIKSVFLTYNEIFKEEKENSKESQSKDQGHKDLKDSINSLNTNLPFSIEYSMINQFMTNYINWQKSTKDMLSDHMKRKKEGEKLQKDLDILIKKEEEKGTLSSKVNSIIKRKEKIENLLKSKIKMEDIQNVINIGKNLKINVDKELESIESCLKEALEWDEIYLVMIKNHKPISEISILLNNLENILVSTELMYSAIDLITKYNIFDTKAENYYKNREFLTDELYKNLLTLIDEYKIINYEDENLKLKLSLLIEIRNKVNNDLEQIRNTLVNESDIEKLKRLKDSIDNNIFKSEIEKIDQKIFYLQNLENLLSSKNDLENLEKIGNMVHDYNIKGNKYTNIINSKKEKIIVIKKKIEEYVSNESQYMPNVEECENLLKEIEENKIILEEEKIITDFIYIHKWYQENLTKNFLSDELSEEDIFSEINKVTKREQFLKGEIKIFYEKLFYFIWHKKAEKIVNIIQSCKGDKKLEISQLEDVRNQTQFEKFNPEDFKRLNDLMNNFFTLLSNWNENFLLLQKLVYEEDLKNLSGVKNLISSLLNDDQVISKIHLNEKIVKINKFATLTKISEKLIELFESKKLPLYNRYEISTINALLQELSLETQSNNIDYDFTSMYYYKQLNSEIEKFNSWMEKFSQYISHKRNNQIEKIDMSLLEVLIEESKRLIPNVSVEVSVLRRDIEGNKTWIETAKKLIEISDSFNNIDKIVDNEENLSSLNKLYSDLISNQISVGDKNIIDSVKSLEWASRARLLLKESTLKNYPLNYRTAFRTSQEANSLKHFPDIKKKDYYSSLLTQVTLAKSIRDIAEILKSHNQSMTQTVVKQITEDQFDKIIRDFLHKCLIDLPEEKEIVENFSKNKNEIYKRYESMTITKSNIQEFEKFLNELKKFPIKMDKLINSIESILSEAKSLQKELKKLIDGVKSGRSHLIKDKISPLYEKCKNLNCSFTESEQLVKMYETSQENMKSISSLLSNSNLSEYEIYDVVSLLDTIEVHNFSEEKNIRKELWERKYKVLMGNLVSSLPSYNTLKNMQSEAKELNLLNQENSILGEEYNNLISIIKQAEEMIIGIQMCQNKEQLNELKSRLETMNFDLSEFIIEQEMRIHLNKMKYPILIGNKRKNEETLTLSNKKKKLENSERNLDEDEILEKKILIELVDEGVSISSDKKNEGSISDQPQTIAATRSRRNINIKIDKDYYYDKDFIENFSSKNTMQSKPALVEESEVLENYAAIENDEKNLDNSHSKLPSIKKMKEDINVIGEEEGNNLDLNNIPQNKKSSKEKDNKDTREKKRIEQFEKILNDNAILHKEGSSYIHKLALELEDDLKKSFPKEDANFKKALTNMTQTVKELEKYRKVSILITKGKLSLVKVSKFPYGVKYFEKLKKIEESTSKSNSIKKDDEKIKDNKDSIQSKKSDVIATSQTSHSKETSIFDMLKDMNNLYSSLNKNNPPLSIKEIQPFNSKPPTEEEEDDDNDSLRSLSDQEGIKFSPGGNYNLPKEESSEILSVGATSLISASTTNIYSSQNYLTTPTGQHYLTTKSSSVQSPNSPNQISFLPKEISQNQNVNFNVIDVSVLGKIYDPFNMEDEARDKENSYKEEFSTSVTNVQNKLKSNHKQSKPLRVPIFYDPTKKPLHSEQNSNTDKPKLRTISSILPTKSQNATLQIWKGSLQVSKIADLKNLMMCSTNNKEEFLSVPSYPSTIQINSRANLKEVISYIEKYLVTKTKTILTGWFEIDSESQAESYQKLAEEYDKSDRSGFIMLNEDKVYIFTLSQKYPKFYKKMKNEIKIYNKEMMNRVEKLIVFVIIRKGEYSELQNESLMMQPVVLSTNEKNNLVPTTTYEKKIIALPTDLSQTQEERDLKNQHISDKKDPANISPITSDEEDNDLEDDEENETSNQLQGEQASKNKLQELLDSDNAELLEEYVNKEFANLAQEEIIEKLMSLDENSRAKLINFIAEYQLREAAQTGVDNEVENQQGVEQEENEGDDENVIMQEENLQVSQRYEEDIIEVSQRQEDFNTEMENEVNKEKREEGEGKILFILINNFF
jgi:hypothetical protein